MNIEGYIRIMAEIAKTIHRLKSKPHLSFLNQFKLIKICKQHVVLAEREII